MNKVISKLCGLSLILVSVIYLTVRYFYGAPIEFLLRDMPSTDLSFNPVFQEIYMIPWILCLLSPFFLLFVYGRLDEWDRKKEEGDFMIVAGMMFFSAIFFPYLVPLILGIYLLFKKDALESFPFYLKFGLVSLIALLTYSSLNYHGYRKICLPLYKAPIGERLTHEIPDFASLTAQNILEQTRPVPLQLTDIPFFFEALHSADPQIAQAAEKGLIQSPEPVIAYMIQGNEVDLDHLPKGILENFPQKGLPVLRTSIQQPESGFGAKKIAISLLGSLSQEQEDIPLLLSFLDTCKNGPLVRESLLSLIKMGGKEVAPTLLKYVNHPAHHRTAIEGLAKLGEINSLIRLYKKSSFQNYVLATLNTYGSDHRKKGTCCIIDNSKEPITQKERQILITGLNELGYKDIQMFNPSEKSKKACTYRINRQYHSSKYNHNSGRCVTYDELTGREISSYHLEWYDQKHSISYLMKKNSGKTLFRLNETARQSPHAYNGGPCDVSEQRIYRSTRAQVLSQVQQALPKKIASLPINYQIK